MDEELMLARILEVSELILHTCGQAKGETVPATIVGRFADIEPTKYDPLDHPDRLNDRPG